MYLGGGDAAAVGYAGEDGLAVVLAHDDGDVGVGVDGAAQVAVALVLLAAELYHAGGDDDAAPAGKLAEHLQSHA